MQPLAVRNKVTNGSKGRGEQNLAPNTQTQYQSRNLFNFDIINSIMAKNKKRNNKKFVFWASLLLIFILILVLLIFYKVKNPECKSFSVDKCPSRCVVCPPCEVCSSISCQTEKFCSSMGFDRTWYEQMVTKTPSTPPEHPQKPFF